MTGFESILSSMPEFTEAVENINKHKAVHLTGMTGTQKSHYIYSVCKALEKNCLVITTDEIEAARISRDLSFFFGDEVCVFPNKEYVFYEVDASTHIPEHARIKALYNLKKSKPVVTTLDAVSKYTLSSSDFDKYTVEFSVGEIFDSDEIFKLLVIMGYKRTPMVEGSGQFSVRGSIIDIFSPLYQNPVRIDLFDDEIDSLRFFDCANQVSIENTDSFAICPAKELALSEEKIKMLISDIYSMKNENFMRDAEKLRQFGYLNSIDKYFPYVCSSFYSVVDYVNDDTIVFVDEAKILSEKNAISYKELNEMVSDYLSKGILPKGRNKYALDYTDIMMRISEKKVVSVSSLSHSCPGISPMYLGSVTAKSVHGYSGKVNFLYDDLKYWKKNNYKVIMVLNGESRIKNVQSALADEEIEAVISGKKTEFCYGNIYLTDGAIDKGFEYTTVKTVVITDSVSAPRKKLRVRNSAKKSGDVIKSFDDLKNGDYVVHRTHGIGQYVGIAQLTVDGITKDFLKIKYKGSDFLYVPTNQLDYLYKYVGSEAVNVKINSLGGVQWNKTVSKVKQSVDELAEDLIQLYARRGEIKGHVFSEDTPWQKEFEENFMYEETEDQLRCIAEIKRDMEQGKCMDRLLCGDVGYGKTEVAIRAAFKCVMEGMQVAYLVPTTILAQQHFNNFSARMGEYAMKVELLSRFRTKKQIEKTVSGLKSGSVDVVIGTHRLLQKDVNFKNLGLLIIDEEQRFGVGHKEKLKALKNDVNVLTLSATPIPRTLNMAIVGIRDLSVLSQPPGDRYPVQTFVMEYNAAVVENAIRRELERNGQVYYLFNRVDAIDKVAARISELVPEARVAVAHGQMGETQLEDIMMSLLEGEIDVLVCTTIIETGLDVPNVNTIIIENADCLGLSQLYQLKGRVGRSNRLAYAYLTYHPGKILDSVAHKRLRAIKEYTEFGSGFKIAMRDLEIRGAGNLLGKAQHGNMNLVGYDMYCMLLEQAVKEKKGIEYTPPLEVNIDISVDAYIPETYVQYEQQRIELYKKIASIDSAEDYYDLQAEFIDRFGDLTKSVENLLDISYIKSLCKIASISDVYHNDNTITFVFTDKASPEAVIRVLDEYKREMKFVSGEKSKILYKCNGNIISNIKIILQKLEKAIQECN